MKKKILFVLMTLSAVLMISGCGSISYEVKARERAQRYVNEKYGFSAEISAVVLSENSWLEFSWEAPLFAHVRMRHGGTEFDVLVPIRDNDPDFMCDNYEAEKICGEIRSYVGERLKCSASAFRIDYGNSYGNHLLTKDIRSARDLVNSDKQKVISVFTCGLDPESVKELDPEAFGENTYFSVVEWTDEKLPEVPYGLIRGLPSQCGWNVSAVHYTENDGSWTHLGYDRIKAGNICLVMPEKCGMTLAETEGTGAADDIPVTGWYSVKGAGEGYGALYVDVSEGRDEEYCIEYERNGKVHYERVPHTDGESPEYELCSHWYCSEKGESYIFRIVKRDFYGYL